MSKIYPYSIGSDSAKALAEALNIRRIKPEGRDLHVKGTIINWGSSGFTRSLTYENELLNSPDAVANAVNKLQAFKCMDGHTSIPPWTDDREEALEWFIRGMLDPIVIRHKLTGHSGDGIQLFEEEQRYTDPFPVAPLYTKYIKKRQEYRLHVFRDKVFFTQRKARNKDVPDENVNWQIRNHANGFIFAHQGVDCGPQAEQYAVAAVRSLGLDFGAVDIIKGVDDRWYVLEVNTACGLEGTTLEKYAEVFKEFV